MANPVMTPRINTMKMMESDKACIAVKVHYTRVLNAVQGAIRPHVMDLFFSVKVEAEE